MHVVTALTPRTHRAAEDQQRNKRTCAEMVSSLKKKFTGCCCSTDGSFQKSYQSGRLFGAEAAHSARTPSWIVHFKCLQPRTSNAERYLQMTFAVFVRLMGASMCLAPPSTTTTSRLCLYCPLHRAVMICSHGCVEL